MLVLMAPGTKKEQGLKPGLLGLRGLLKAEEGEKLQVSWQLLVTQDSEQGSALEYHQIPVKHIQYIFKHINTIDYQEFSLSPLICPAVSWVV